VLSPGSVLGLNPTKAFGLCWRVVRLKKKKGNCHCITGSSSVMRSSFPLTIDVFTAHVHTLIHTHTLTHSHTHTHSLTHSHTHTHTLTHTHTHTQDSLRTLVQDSLVSFVQLVEDSCHSSLNLTQDYQWDTPLTESKFKSVL